MEVDSFSVSKVSRTPPPPPPVPDPLLPYTLEALPIGELLLAPPPAFRSLLPWGEAADWLGEEAVVDT